MKKTMSPRNVAKFHKLIEKKVPLKKISKHMNIEENTLRKFTPAALEDVKKKQTQIVEAKAAEKIKTEKAGAAVAAAAKEISKDK